MSDIPTPPIIVGTRGSELALVQATATEASLAQAFPRISIQRQVIKTTGDRRTDVALSEVAKAEGIFDKGVFIKELEQALDSGDIDIAVHSLKDMPTTLGERFELAAVLERAPIRDVLITRQPGGLDGLPKGARVGTSSVRRAMQLKWLRPDLVTQDIRGNVPTRLQKLSDGNDYDAILLAEAGLIRLNLISFSKAEGAEFESVNGFTNLHVYRLPEDQFLPAAGQGAIGLEIRSHDARSRALAHSIGHAETWTRIRAEREFLRLLDGGCHTPVGVSSCIKEDYLFLKAIVFPEQGGTPKTAEVSGLAANPISLAFQLFQSLS